MTALLGGSTGSRLFTNVRERLGCCYYCGARVNLLTGILLIECGLEEANRNYPPSSVRALRVRPQTAKGPYFITLLKTAT